MYNIRIRVNDEGFLQIKGPLILASNHPNAFLDAIILATRMNQPVHFLATGELTDKFLNRWILKILRIIPVYHIQDKSGNPERNEKSFIACVDVLLKEGIVLIFSEGISENNWQLRQIKKGTARTALAAWNHAAMQSRLRILPVGLNYNSFNQAGKALIIRFGKPIMYEDLVNGSTEAEKMNLVNELLKERLSDTILHTETRPEMVQSLISNTSCLQYSQFKKLQEGLDGSMDQSVFLKLKPPGFIISGNHTLTRIMVLIILLAIPAALGWVLHVFLYYPLKIIVEIKTERSVYFDSVLFASLFLVYPFYWIGSNAIVYFYLKNVMIQLLLICMPLLVWTTLHWKENFQRVRNYFILSKQERKLFANYFN